MSGGPNNLRLAVSQRVIEMIKLRTELNKLGAKLVEIPGGGIKVQCSEETREQVVQLMNDAGFVTPL